MVTEVLVVHNLPEVPRLLTTQVVVYKHGVRVMPVLLVLVEPDL